MNGSPAASKDCPASDNLFRPADLIAAWQERADYLHQFGAPNSARIWRIAAVELEHTLAAEALAPETAAQLTGYSPDYIRKQRAHARLGQ